MTDTNIEYEVLLKHVQEAMRLRHVQEIMWAILAMCGLYSDQFTNQRESTDYLLGKRAIGLEILQLLEDADPSIYPQLLLTKSLEVKGDHND